MNLSDFHFLRPEWFLAALPIALLWLLAKRQQLRSSWNGVCDPHLLPYILSGGPVSQKRRIGISILFGTLLTVTALAGPTWERLPQPVFRPQSALVILLDLSSSMNCPDISPSRLTRAKYKVADILKRRQEGQTALVVFAADAFTVTPLTNDTNTITSLLGSLDTSIMPSQGSRADLALEKGVQLIKQAGLNSGDLLLIGDGFSSRQTLKLAETSAAEGFHLSVLAVGTPEAAPIPTSNGFLQDGQGSIVLPKLDETGLRELAKRGSGTYSGISIDDSDIDSLLAASESNLRQGELEKTEQLADRWQDRGYWLLLPLLPLAALAFRRGLIFSLLWLLFLPPAPAQALEVANLWQTPDQQAAAQLQQGDAAAAAEAFTDPNWKAVAQYRAGQYQQSLDSLQQATDPTSIYNKGNALAQLGRYQEAIDAYQQIAKDDPNYSDAQHNKELLEKLLDEQSQQQNQQNQQNQENSDQQQDNKQQLNDQQDSTSPKDESSDRSADEQNAQQNSAQQNQSQQDSPLKTPEQERNDAAQQQAQQAKQKATDEKKQAEAATAADEAKEDAQDPAEPWLNRIQNDPGNLLKRKFLYQYRQRQTRNEDQPW